MIYFDWGGEGIFKTCLQFAVPFSMKENREKRSLEEMVRLKAVWRTPARCGWLWRGAMKSIVRGANIYGACHMCQVLF